MLAALSIRDIVIIDKLDLTFGPGMSALTGETGAGKSILLDAFALALGARGDAGLVRAGAKQGVVTAQFDVPRDHAIHAFLQENGIEAGGEAVLRRIQSADGRSRAFINDVPAGVQLLRRAGALLVEIHGQHEDRALMDQGAQRRLLDAYGGLLREAHEVAGLWRDWREAIAAHRESLDKAAAARRDIDYIRHAAKELEAVDPQPGEEDELASRRQRMQSAGKIAADLKDLASALNNAAGGVKLGAVLRKLERQPAAAELMKPIAAAVERMLIEAGEASNLVEAAARGGVYSERDLEAAEERLFKLREMARKHRIATAELPELMARFRAELAAFNSSEEDAARLGAQAAAAGEAYGAAARLLSAKRAAAASRLDAAIAKELKPLRLERARFITRLHAAQEGEDGAAGGPGGLETISFEVQTNPGSPGGPLMKVASGGELSRFVLALKVALAEKGGAPTLIFDEIDSGVGGATSAAIGERLCALAEGLQVFAITHAPQVAAHAAQHFFIIKEPVAVNGAEAMATRVVSLDDAGRREEIARMLAGATVTDEARSAAARLIGARA